MYLQCSQTSLRTTAATRSLQCWENIQYAAAGNTPTVFEESPCRAKHFQTRCTFYLTQLKQGVCITETIAPPRDLEIVQVSHQIKSQTILSQVSKDLASISALILHISIC